MDGSCSRCHWNLYGWSPHVRAAHLLRDVSQLMGDSIVASCYRLSSDLVVCDVHEGCAGRIVGSGYDGVCSDVVADVSCRRLVGGWNQDLVDDVHHTVRGHNICLSHCRLADLYRCRRRR